MDNSHYEDFIKNGPFGYAYLKIVFENGEEQVDFEFIEVNRLFEELTCIESGDVAGKKLTEVFPDLKESSFDWIGFLSETALNGGTKNFEQYLEDLKCWYSGSVHSNKKNYISVIFEDSTNPKNIFGSILSEKKHLETLIDSVPLPVFYKDKEGFYLDVNKAFQDFTGLPEGEIIGKNAFDFNPEELAKIYQEKDKELIEHPGNQIYEAVVRDSKGVTHNVVFHKTTMFDDDGKVEGIGGVILEITDLKKALETLKENEEKFSKAFQNSPDIVLISTLTDGRIIEANESIYRIAGYTREEIIGSTAEDINHWTSIELRSEFLEKVQKTGRVQNYEVDFKKKSGELFTCLISAEIIQIKDMKCVLSVIHDISDRKEAEKKLQESERRSNALIDALPDMMFRLNRQGVYLDYKASTDFMYYKFDALSGKVDSEIARPEFLNLIKDKIENTLTTRETQIFEYEFPDKHGNTVIFEARMVPCGEDEVIAIVRDISERKRSEEALKESEHKFRELNATKDKFFNIIAHDLKNPFNAIVGFSNILAEQLKDKEYTNVEQYAEIIRQSSYRAINLLKNLMDWARSQTGRMEFSPEYVEAVGLINEVVELLGDSALQKNITIVKEVPAKAPVIADKAMISTVLRNLVSNAVKFTKPGGRIVIKAELKPAELLVSVTDDGVGIRKDVIEKLFRIDESVSTEGTAHEEGTGLGLILSKEFIEKHRGKIWVESTQGVGSKFSFTLPLS
jgi:PAS domain S-box-containing protein